MLKKAPQLCSRVAQNLDVREEYASASRSLRPRWATFLTILQGLGKTVQALVVSGNGISFFGVLEQPAERSSVSHLAVSFSHP
jgi:hypothetical protein